MRLPFVFVCIIVHSASLYAQDLHFIYAKSDNIYSPSAFYVLGEDTVLTVELSNKDAVLSLINLKNNTVIGTQREGRGPGEMQTSGSKYISWFNENSILVWDDGLYRGAIYDKELNYLGDLKKSNHDAITSLIVLNDTTVLYKELFGVNNIAKTNEIRGTELTSRTFKEIKINKISGLEEIARNPLVNQGPVYAENDKAYLGFNFSSTILVISKNGMAVDTLLTPVYLPFPVVKFKDGYAAPDHSKWPAAALSIAADAHFIYVLYSGKIFDDSIFKQVSDLIRGKIADSIENSDNSTTIHIYDKKSYTFRRELNLPIQAKRIFVHNGSLYTLSYNKGEYQIIKYKISLQ